MSETVPFITAHDVDLSTANTMALSCVASTVATINDPDVIPQVLDRHAPDDTAVLVLSGGSNVVLPPNISGLVVLPRHTGFTVTAEDTDTVDVTVAGGHNWHRFVTESVEHGWYGIENLALIPGLVGAAPVQNIGAYGVQVGDVVTHVTAFHLPTRTWHQLSASQCRFGYRDSVFKQSPETWIITRVGFRLHKDPTQVHTAYGDVNDNAAVFATAAGRVEPTPHDVMHAIITIREQKLPDPAQLANCGSFFQNPIISTEQYAALVQDHRDVPSYPIDDGHVKLPAAWLIDQVGLKGQGVPPILTHTNQALVLTNHAPGKATQCDIAAARDLIVDTVHTHFGVVLRPEPIWIGTDGRPVTQ